MLAGCGTGADVVAAAAPPPDVTATIDAPPDGTVAAEVTVARGATPAPRVTPGAADAVPGLSAKTLRRLSKDTIWHVQVVDEARERPKLSAAEILALPRVRAEPPVEMALVRQGRTPARSWKTR